jgi:hypothetical protein
MESPQRRETRRRAPSKERHVICSGPRMQTQSTTRFGMGVLALWILAGCGATPEGTNGTDEVGQTDQAITGGAPDPDPGSPAVGIVYTSNGLCTGTLVARAVVLTAAHCVLNAELDAFYTGTGSATTPGTVPPGMSRHPIDKAVIHPSYSPNGDPQEIDQGFDLALVHLTVPDCVSTPWTIDPTVPAAGTPCIAVGYGISKDSGTETTGLRKFCSEVSDGPASNDLESFEQGTNLFNGLAQQGDSGGPVVCTPIRKIAGVVSFTPQFSTTVFYARVDSQAAWVSATAAQLSANGPACTAIYIDPPDCSAGDLRCHPLFPITNP